MISSLYLPRFPPSRTLVTIERNCSWPEFSIATRRLQFYNNNNNASNAQLQYNTCKHITMCTTLAENGIVFPLLNHVPVLELI